MARGISLAGYFQGMSLPDCLLNAAVFGELLRSWRQRRNLSQLELALEAEVSARHVSFL
jgi:hypothetical protein